MYSPAGNLPNDASYSVVPVAKRLFMPNAAPSNPEPTSFSPAMVPLAYLKVTLPDASDGSVNLIITSSSTVNSVAVKFNLNSESTFDTSNSALATLFV